MNSRKAMALAGMSAAVGFALTSVALAATAHKVMEKGKKFSEKELAIAVGDSVVFVNDDNAKHNIMIRDMKFDSGLKAPGTEVEVKFAEAGKYKVRCAIHPKMKMVVVAK